MKIIIPFRNTIIAFAIGLICLLPNSGIGQCLVCPTVTTETLPGCDAGTDGTNGIFNLNLIPDSNPATVKYFTECRVMADSVQFIPGKEITSGLAVYAGVDGDTIFVQELNGNGDCINVFAAKLDVIEATVTRDPSDGVICAPDVATLTAEIDGGYTLGDPAWVRPGGSTFSGPELGSSEDGIHSVTITPAESGGCTMVRTIEVFNEGITVMTSAMPALCKGSSTGSITISAEGGGGAQFTFAVQGETNQSGGTMQTFTGLAAGSYGITVTDNDGGNCTVTASQVVDEPMTAFDISLGATAPTMVGGADGKITVTTSNGTGPYDWEYETNVVGQSDASGSGVIADDFDITGLRPEPGLYDVTVTDASNCTAQATIEVPNLACSLAISSAVGNSPTCPPGQGSITVASTSFDAPYRIDYNGAMTGFEAGITSGSTTITGLNTGTYGLTVTDADGCTATSSGVVITPPATITFTAGTPTPSCNNSSNGKLQISNIANGTANYSVKFDAPGTSNDMTTTAASSTSRLIENIAPDTYDVSIVDAQGCESASVSVTILELDEVTVEIDGDVILCSDDAGGTLTTTTSFSNYAWSTGDDDRTISITNTFANKNYMVTVTDASGCTGSTFVIVKTLPVLAVSLNTSSSKTSVTCDSDCDGRIDLNVVGGDLTYGYSWTGPGGYTSGSKNIAALCPGLYSLIVTDGNGCTRSFSQEISVPDPITISTSASEATCNGDSDGAITASALGGTPDYDFVWSPGGQTTQSISGLSAGTYTVRVTDENGCFTTASAVVNEPPAVVGVIAPGNPEICNGESITLSVDGGTFYNWGDGLGSGDAVLVSPEVTTTYMVTVTDANTNNCTDVAAVTVTVNQLPTATISVAETSGVTNDDKKICEGEPITITAAGGISYNWEGGVSNPFTVTPGTGMESYSVTVTDGKGCQDNATVDVEIFDNPTAEIDLSSVSRAQQDPQNIKNNSVANCGTLIDCAWVVPENAGITGNCDGVTPTFPTVGPKNIMLTVENSCGCVDTKTTVLEIDAADQCAVEEFTVNSGVGVACVGVELDVFTKERPSPNCNVAGNSFLVFENETLLEEGVDYVYTSDKVSFNAPGEYRMQFTTEDNCNCKRPSNRFIEIVPVPSISFASGNVVEGCAGQELEVNFAGFNPGEKVRVMYADGNIFSYEESNFRLVLGANGKETLTILSVDNGTCEIAVTGQVLEIDVTPKFEIVDIDTPCSDDGLTYRLIIKTTGGDPNANIIAEGTPGTTSGANTFIIRDLDPTKAYDFTLSRGDICESVPVSVGVVRCNCTFAPGEYTDDSGFFGCEDEVFDISNIFSTEVQGSDFDPVKDTLIYVLHNQATGLSLGTVFRILPSSTTMLDNNFPGFIPDYQFYKLSVVGLRRSTLGDFELDKPETLSGAGALRCVSVKSGVPVIWNKAPSPELGTNGGVREICRNAYDFMVFARNRQEGSSISFSIEGVAPEDIKSYGFQDTAFVHFPDNGQDSFNITIRESKESFSGGETRLCEGETVTTIYVRDGIGAPPLSEIILWPGNILASTADTVDTCFEWGFLRPGLQSGVVGTNKYLFAPSDIDFDATDRVYFVDTYYCNNPDCVTRVYYNAEGPTPGLNYKEEESFSYLIKPNPNRGQFTLDLFSDQRGEFDLRVIDLTGKALVAKKSTFEIGKNTEEFDLGQVPKGIYFIQIRNRELNEYSIDKVVIN